MTPTTPFSSQYSANLPELMLQLNCSIALSTFQANKVIIISPKSDETLVQLPRGFDGPMGISAESDRLGIATKTEVILFRNDRRLGVSYPQSPNVYTDMYMPRVTIHTGALDIHDLEFQKDKVIGVSSAFSTIVELGGDRSLKPIWKPDFITDLTPGDFCHLNGMALDQNSEIKYATAFAKSNKVQGWRESMPEGGLLMDVPNNKILLDNIKMPHSPKIFDDRLIVLESATGKILEYNAEKNTIEVVNQLPGFVRGMAKINDFLIVGVSRLRHNSSIFKELPIAQEKIKAGFYVIHLPTKAVVADYQYNSSVDEIYDIQVLPNQVRPSILNPQSEQSKLGLSLEDTTFWGQNA